MKCVFITLTMHDIHTYMQAYELLKYVKCTCRIFQLKR